MTDVEKDCSILVEWFLENYLTLNADQCNLLVSGYNYESIFAKVGYALLWEENSVKLISLFIDSDLSFHGHVKVTCKKASQKLSVITRLANLTSDQKKNI